MYSKSSFAQAEVEVIVDFYMINITEEERLQVRWTALILGMASYPRFPAT